LTNEAANQQRSDDAQKLDDLAQQKTEEAMQDRRDIAQDQTSTIAEETSRSVIGVWLNTGKPLLGGLVRVNMTGKEIRRSPLDTVHVRTITFIGGKIIAIAGESSDKGAVRLVEINPNNLEMARQGDDDLMTGSLLWVNGNDIYAITNDISAKANYLGRFNTNLQLPSARTVRRLC